MGHIFASVVKFIGAFLLIFRYFLLLFFYVCFRVPEHVHPGLELGQPKQILRGVLQLRHGKHGQRNCLR